MAKFFLENSYIMGYNFKKSRNGKSTLKIPKWPMNENLLIFSVFIIPFESDASIKPNENIFYTQIKKTISVSLYVLMF